MSMIKLLDLLEQIESATGKKVYLGGPEKVIVRFSLQGGGEGLFECWLNPNRKLTVSQITLASGVQSMPVIQSLAEKSGTKMGVFHELVTGRENHQREGTDAMAVRK